MGRDSDKTRKKGKLSKVIHVLCLCSRSSCLKRDSAFEMFEYAKCLREKKRVIVVQLSNNAAVFNLFGFMHLP